MVANLKGGVGKTTLAANLAAYFCENGKRALLVDVDYQGSLSNMLLSADQVLDVPDGINDLLRPGDGVPDFHQASVRFSNVLRGSAIVPARYQLASLENKILIEYLLQDDHDDGRYRLAKSLLSEEVSKTFDVAIIDAPPRLTAAAVNAFCASTHLLVPTVYDKLSAEAVGTFLNGAHILKGALNHGIDLLGIVGMLTSQQHSLSQREQDAKSVAMRQASQTWGPNHHFFDRHIPRKAAIAAAAGEEIAYYRDATVRAWFDELGKAISERLWWDYGVSRDRQERATVRLSQVIVAEVTQENQKVMNQ
jgi:chromosome partitioning protein